MKGKIIGSDEYTDAWSLDGHSFVEVPKWVTKQVKAEGEKHGLQKSQEVLDLMMQEAKQQERQRICTALDEMWSAIYGMYLNNQDLREIIKNVVTHPNNQK